MSQTIAIILRIKAERADEFERLFEEQELPIWRDFAAQGKFINASLTRAQEQPEHRSDVQDFILHVEVPSMREHSEHDDEPRFKVMLERAQDLHAAEPLVWFGNTRFREPA